MYYFRKKSKGKIIHTADCFHLFNTDIRNIGWFETLSEAYAKGYRLCKHCNINSNSYFAAVNRSTFFKIIIDGKRAAHLLFHNLSINS